MHTVGEGEVLLRSTREEEIRNRAYEIYLQRGGQPGYELEDWLQAERGRPFDLNVTFEDSYGGIRVAHLNSKMGRVLECEFLVPKSQSELVIPGAGEVDVGSALLYAGRRDLRPGVAKGKLRKFNHRV